jgi:hypothetical protein
MEICVASDAWRHKPVSGGYAARVTVVTQCAAIQLYYAGTLSTDLLGKR